MRGGRYNVRQVALLQRRQPGPSKSVSAESLSILPLYTRETLSGENFPSAVQISREKRYRVATGKSLYMLGVNGIYGSLVVNIRQKCM